MKTLTINVTRKNGKYIGTLEECPQVTAEADLIDDIVHAIKVSIINMDRKEMPEALQGGPLKFRLCGSEKVFSSQALERDTKSRLALNERLDRMNEHLERIAPLTMEEVALHIFCHYRPTVSKSLLLLTTNEWKERSTLPNSSFCTRRTATVIIGEDNLD